VERLARQITFSLAKLTIFAIFRFGAEIVAERLRGGEIKRLRQRAKSLVTNHNRENRDDLDEPSEKRWKKRARV
jgi:hypothetical protein